MAKHRHVIIGAGRIGAGYQWSDLEYTHAGASQALRDRVELVGFIEPDADRAAAAKLKWQVPVIENVMVALDAWKPDIVSICVQPERQFEVLTRTVGRVKGIWCEKPWMGGGAKLSTPIQVNYLRRGDAWHQSFVDKLYDSHQHWTLIVYGKDDIHTKCHFVDLARWWNVDLDYRPFNGPCAYLLYNNLLHEARWFDHGGLWQPGEAMKAMLGNLVDHIDLNTPLWSPA